MIRWDDPYHDIESVIACQRLGILVVAHIGLCGTGLAGIEPLDENVQFRWSKIPYGSVPFEDPSLPTSPAARKRRSCDAGAYTYYSVVRVEYNRYCTRTRTRT